MAPQPLSFLLASLLLAAADCLGLSADECRPISVEACSGIGYNYTWANVDQSDTMQAALVKQINFGQRCSKQLRRFLCSTYLPMCDSKVQRRIGPCRSLCERVLASCSEVLRQQRLHGLLRLSQFNCSQMPVFSNGLCVPGEHECDHLTRWANYVYFNYSNSCALRCHADGVFDSGARRAADLWLGVASCLCCLGCLATILTFALASVAKQLRPLLFVAACCACCGLAHLLRLLAGREASACDTVAGELVLTWRGLDKALCALVFLLHFYFGLAAAAWGAVLALNWLTAAAQGQTGGRCLRACCVQAWLLPGILTVVVLISRRVEADELFGVCDVGVLGNDALLLFRVAPNCVLLLLHVSFVVVGFVRRCRHGNNKQAGGACPLPAVTCCALPAACAVCVGLYELALRDSWRLAERSGSPSTAVLLLRPCAPLLTGMATCLWVCAPRCLCCLRRRAGDKLPSSCGTVTRPLTPTPASAGLRSAGRIEWPQRRRLPEAQACASVQKV